MKIFLPVVELNQVYQEKSLILVHITWQIKPVAAVTVAKENI